MSCYTQLVLVFALQTYCISGFRIINTNSDLGYGSRIGRGWGLDLRQDGLPYQGRDHLLQRQELLGEALSVIGDISHRNGYGLLEVTI